MPKIIFQPLMIANPPKRSATRLSPFCFGGFAIHRFQSDLLLISIFQFT